MMGQRAGVRMQSLEIGINSPCIQQTLIVFSLCLRSGFRKQEEWYLPCSHEVHILREVEDKEQWENCKQRAVL